MNGYAALLIALCLTIGLGLGASLLDLARRRYLTITPDPYFRLFGNGVFYFAIGCNAVGAIALWYPLFR